MLLFGENFVKSDQRCGIQSHIISGVTFEHPTGLHIMYEWLVEENAKFNYNRVYQPVNWKRK